MLVVFSASISWILLVISELFGGNTEPVASTFWDYMDSHLWRHMAKDMLYTLWTGFKIKVRNALFYARIISLWIFPLVMTGFFKDSLLDSSLFARIAMLWLFWTISTHVFSAVGIWKYRHSSDHCFDFILSTFSLYCLNGSLMEIFLFSSKHMCPLWVRVVPLLAGAVSLLVLYIGLFYAVVDDE